MKFGGGKRERLFFLLVFSLLFVVQGVSADVVVNEFLPDGIVEPNSEWVELFNNGTSAVNVSNFTITDNEANSNFTIPDILLTPGAFILLVQNSTQFNATFNSTLVFNNSVPAIVYGAAASGLQLANGGDEIILFNGSVQVANATYTASAENVSQGRFPNGVASQVSFTRPTPGTKNDNQPPTLNAVLNPLNNTFVKGNVTIRVNVTDAVHAVNAVLVDFNGTNNTLTQAGDIWSFVWVTPQAPGQPDRTYNLTFLMNDTIGLAVTHVVVNVTVDNTKPAVLLSNTTNTLLSGTQFNFSIRPATFTLNATVTDANAQTVLFNLSNASGQVQLQNGLKTGNHFVASLNTTNLADVLGGYNITAIANDSVNNVNASEFVTLFVDLSKPNTTLTRPSTNQNLLGNFVLNVSVTDSHDVKTVQFNLSNSTNGNVTPLITGVTSSSVGSQFNATLNASAIAEGRYNVSVRATDSAGNVNETTFAEVFIDGTKPSVTITRPPVNSSVSGAVLFNASVTDAVGIGAVLFNVSNSTNGNVTPLITGVTSSSVGSQFNATFNTSTIPDGFYNISVQANDLVNNVNASQFVSVLIDNTPPIITFLGCAPNIANLSQRVVCNASVTDTLAGLSSVLAIVSLPNGTNETQTLAANGNIRGFVFNQTVVRGVYNVTWFANDTLKNTNSIVRNFTVQNRPPQLNATIPNQTFAEDNNQTINLSFFFVDPDGDAINFTAVGLTNLSIFINNNTGNATFQPPQNFTGADSIVFTANDAFGGAVTGNNITLNVTPVNDAPFISPAVPNLTIPEDFGTFLLVTTQFEKDLEDVNGTGAGNGLTWTFSGHNASLYNASVFSTLDLFAFTTVSDVSGSEVLTLILTDSGGNSTSQTIVVNITPVNDAPLIGTIPNQTITEDTTTTFNLTPLLSDTDNAVSSLIVATNRTNVQVNGQVLVFNYTNQTISQEAVRVNVSDGVNTTTTFVNVSVTFVNDAPAFGTLPLQTRTEDAGPATLNLTPFVSDEETAVAGLTLTLTTENTSQVDCLLVGQSINFTPAANFSGLGRCELQASDGSAASRTNLSINVTPVNDAVQFVAVIPNQTLTEDTPGTLNLTTFWSDVDGDALGFNVVSVGANLSITINNATRIATLTPAANFSGTSNTTLSATDGSTSANSNNIIVTVTGANDETPLVSPFPTIFFNEDSFNDSINLSNFVADADTPDSQINWTKIGDPSISFAIVRGEFANFSAVPNFCGATAVTLRANDGNNTDDESVSISVNCVPDAPVVTQIAPANNSIQNTTIIFSWNATDADNDALTFLLQIGTTSDPSTNVTTTGTSATVTGLANNVQHFWRVVARDATLNSTTPVRQFTVQTNLPPVINSFNPSNTAPTVAEGNTLAFSVSASDPENGALNITWFLDGRFNTTDVNFTFRPGFSDAGAHSVLANVSDTVNNSVSQAWAVTVVNNNSAPTINGVIPSQTLTEDGSSITLDLTPFERDVEDGDAGLTWRAADVDTRLVSISVNTVTDDATITLVANAFGSDTVTFVLTDSGGLNVSQNVVVTVTGVNDSPTIAAFSPSFTTPKIGDNRTQTFNVSAVDPDGTVPSVSWFVNNVLSGTGATFSHTGTALGTFTIEAKATDGVLNATTQSWTLTVSRTPILNTFDGATTSNVTALNDSQLQSVSNFTLERSAFARIEFLQPVDLRDVVDLDNLVFSANNILGIDTREFVGLNRAARITLFNVNINSPVILFDNGFTTNASAITTACDFCTIVNNSNGRLVFDVSHFTTFAAASSTSAELEVPGSVKVGGAAVQRNTTVQSSFSIRNKGTPGSLTNVQVTGSAGSQFNLLFSLDNNNFASSVSVGTLGPLANATVFVRAAVPANEDGGEHDFADITVSSTQSTKTITSVLMDPKSFLRIKSVDVGNDDLNDGGSADIEPDTDVDIDVEVENLFTNVDIEDIEIEVTILDIDDNDDIEESSDEFDLDGGDEETKTISVKIPEDLDEDSYDIEIEASGTDQNGAEHIAKLKGKLNTEKEDHKLTLDSDLSVSDVSCARNPTLRLTVKNLGEDDEDDVRITVENSALGIDEVVRSIDIDENDDYRTSVTLNLEKAKEGTYNLDVRVFRDENKQEDNEVVAFTVKRCTETRGAAGGDVAEKQIREQHQQLLNSILAAQQPAVVVQERQGNDWFWVVVVVLGVVNAGVIVFVVGAGIIKKKQKMARLGSVQRPNDPTLPARTVVEMRDMKETEMKDKGTAKPKETRRKRAT